MSYDQTNGYGQRNAPWIGEKDCNVSLSIIFYPNFLPSEMAFYLSMAIALAVKKAVEEIAKIPAYIKWPNDLMLNDRKVAGILIETSFQESWIEKAFCGIGLNVNQEEFGEIKELATSIKQVKQISFDLDEASLTLLEWVEKYYLQLKAGRYKEIRDDYNNALHRKGEMIELKRKDNSYFKAMVIGVTDDGRLEVQLENGESAKFIHGEIQITYNI